MRPWQQVPRTSPSAKLHAWVMVGGDIQRVPDSWAAEGQAARYLEVILDEWPTVEGVEIRGHHRKWWWSPDSGLVEVADS